MKTLAIRDLKNNPSDITKYLQENETVFITKHSKPIGVTIPLNDDVLSIGVKKMVAIDQYKNGMISLGKMAEFLEISKQEARSLVETLGIEWLSYTEEEIESEVETIREYVKK